MGKQPKGKQSRGDTNRGSPNTPTTTNNRNARAQPIAQGSRGTIKTAGEGDDDLGEGTTAVLPTQGVAKNAIPWQADHQLTDQFIAHISENERLRGALLTDGRLRKLEDSDDSEDEHFFDIANQMFKDNNDHLPIKQLLTEQDVDNKKQVASMMKERWRELVDQTEVAFKDLGEGAKGIHLESQAKNAKDQITQKKLKDIKKSHPWYWKLSGLLHRQPRESLEAATTDANTPVPDEPTSDPKHDTGLNEDLVLVNVPSAAESAGNGETMTSQRNLQTEAIDSTPPTATPLTAASGHNAGNDGEDATGVKTGHEKDAKDHMGKQDDGHSATRPTRIPLPGSPPSETLALPSDETAASVPEPAHHSTGLMPGDADRGQTSPAVAAGRPASRAESARTAQTMFPADHVPTLKPVQALMGPDGKERENQEDHISRANSPAFGQSRSRAGSARFEGKTTDKVVEASIVEPEPVPLEPTIPSQQPSVNGDRPKSVKEWAQDVANTTQVNPLITATEIESLDPAPGEQLPSYSVEADAEPVVPSGSGHQGVGNTGDGSSIWPEGRKSRDDKHPYTAPWAADVNNTPHLGFGYLPPTEPTVAPTPVMDSKAAGKRPLGRPGGGKLAKQDAPIVESVPRSVSPRPRTPQPVAPEPVTPVLNVQIPPQASIEATIQPTAKEPPLDLGNISPISRHSRAPSNPVVFPTKAETTSAVTAAAANAVAESVTEGTKPAGGSRARNISGGSTETVKPKDAESDSPRVHQPKDAFRATPWSSDPSPRPQIPSQSVPTSFNSPAFRHAPSPSSPAIPSPLRSVEPPISTPRQLSFSEADVHPRVTPSPSVSYQYGQPTSNPSTVTFPTSQPNSVKIQNSPRPSSSSRRQDLPPTPLGVNNSSRQPLSQSTFQNVTPGFAGAAALGAAAGYAATKMEDMNKGDRQRRRTSAEQQQGGTYTPLTAMPQQRGAYQPFTSVTSPTGYAAPARPLSNTPVTFDFGNQQDRNSFRGTTDVRRTSGGRNPALATTAPVGYPVSAVSTPRSRSDSIESEETVRQTRPLIDRYEQDRRDRERQLERELEREDDRYGLIRRRRWEDDRSVTTGRVRYASPVRSDAADCDCSSCRNAWIWTSVEYCGLAVAFTLYLAFMAKVLFQNQGIRLF